MRWISEECVTQTPLRFPRASLAGLTEERKESNYSTFSVEDSSWGEHGMAWLTLSLRKKMDKFFLILAFFLLTTGCLAAAGGSCAGVDCQCSGETCSADWRTEGSKCSGCGRAYRGSVQYLHKTISYTNYRTAHVLVEWDFKVNDAPPRTFCIGFDFTTSGEDQHMKNYFCLPNGARRFNLTNVVSRFVPNSCPQPNTVPLANATFKLGLDEFQLGSVGDCWSVMGNRSYDVCGVQVPSPPVNVSAVLSVNSSTNVSTFTVEWSPPLYNNTPILYYMVDIGDSTSIRLFTNSTRVALEITPVSQNTLSINYQGTVLCFRDIIGQDSMSTNKTSVTLQKKMDVLPTRVTVRAGVRISASKSYKRYCYKENSCGEDVYFSGKAVGEADTVNTTSPPIVSDDGGEDPPTSKNWYIIASVGTPVCFFVLVTVATVLLAFAFLKIRRECRGNSTQVGTCSEGVPCVFLSTSTEEDEGMQYKLRYLVHDLADNGIESVYYEYERTSHGPESPATLGISQWVELQFQKCDLVLFAFTKRFLEEWKRESTDQLSPVVWSSRHVLDGLLPHQGNISKFGVVLMGEDCTIPPGLKRFQVFRLFNGDSATIHSEHLIRYILETPPYAPPRVPTA